jgi:outer membrane protein OmpA-like peptidoglycan-associated protein
MRAALRHAALSPALVAGLLAGCAAPPPPQARSYITLLPSPDGTVGQVFIHGSAGQQRIDRARYAAPLDGSAPAAPVDERVFLRDFAWAIAARPEPAQHFALYFETGDVRLTPESLALLPRILEVAARRANADMSIIGHSDTMGPAEQNVALSLKRAQTVADLLRKQGLKLDALVVDSHGERNLLIPTPDETSEPRNRRVEVTIR